jgi:alpha-tubulin suppressor-like RCC1 family protein
LGITALSCFCTPVSILGVKKTFCNISSGSYHTIGIDKNGLVWGWGNNQYGQIGNNSDQTNIYTPISIQGIKKTFCKIMSGQNYTIVIDKNGLVWGWGSNGASQLGDNTGINRCTPVSILGAKKTFCNISAHNGNNVMGIDNKGQVWGWGYNNNGKLGINSIINKCTPVSILGAKKTFCIIAAGNNHTMGINNRGQVWGWGYNNNGQLGINSIIDKCTPVSILGVKKTFCKITAGNNYTLGIDKNGLVWCWGNNNYGQLGDNSLSVRCTPVSILGVKKTFCEISAGYNNTGGIDKNGQVWGWGYNYYGQLGDNSNVSRLTPVSILGTKKTFCKIYFSISTTIAMDYKYQIWGWGNNNSLTLTAIDTTTPIRVYNF